MSIVDEIRPKVGRLHPSLRGAGAWWVGTDVAAERVTEYERLKEAWSAELAEVATELDCHPTKMWRRSIWGEDYVEAFVPNDPDNLAPGLRLDGGRRDRAVPAARYKAGKEVDKKLGALKRTMPQYLRVIGGVTGDVELAADRTGSFRTAFPQILVPRQSTHPILLVNVEPLQDHRGRGAKGTLTVDEEIWQRVPLSVLHEIIERQEVEGEMEES